jgi:hypothetical protein
MKNESDIKKEIRQYLDSLGADCWHVSYMSTGYGKRGVPDRLVCYRGRFLALEVKRDANAPTTAWQKREIAAIVAAGGRAIVCWSVEHVREEIEEIDREAKYEAIPR